MIVTDGHVTVKNNFATFTISSQTPNSNGETAKNPLSLFTKQKNCCTIGTIKWGWGRELRQMRKKDRK
jgi:hypothetical protein